MDITYYDYKNLGYSVIPEEEFARYSEIAVKTVGRYVKNFKKITDENKRCVFEIMDVLYAEHNQSNRILSGFSNENYRENYFEGKNLSPGEKILETLRLYFTNAELCRGV